MQQARQRELTAAVQQLQRQMQHSPPQQRIAHKAGKKAGRSPAGWQDSQAEVEELHAELDKLQVGTGQHPMCPGGLGSVSPRVECNFHILVVLHSIPAHLALTAASTLPLNSWKEFAAMLLALGVWYVTVQMLACCCNYA